MFKPHRVIMRTVALIALPGLLIANLAFAAASVEAAPTVTVSYGDLNLNSAEGIASLYKRIQNAASAVCEPVEGPQGESQIFWTAWNHCYHQGVADAVRAVHNGKLRAYHEKRSGAWRYMDADEGPKVASR